MTQGDPAHLPWPLPARTDLRDALVAAYAQEDRGYHDLRHVSEVLTRLRELGAGGNTEVVLAAWYHDAVYDTAGDNEEASARRAEAELAHTSADVTEVARLVRLTATHRPEPGDVNGALLCDADLAILAAPPERYRDYVAGVRKEYAAVPDGDFRRGRLAVLTQLMANDPLFHTEHARAHWERPARDNLRREIAELES